jgi:hypothetical protein
LIVLAVTPVSRNAKCIKNTGNRNGKEKFAGNEDSDRRVSGWME